MKNLIIGLIALFIFACNKKTNEISPEVKNITESVYASGKIVSKNQYTVYSNVSGVITNIYVDEGDLINLNSPILKIENKTQELSKENAKLNLFLSNKKNNEGKIKEAEELVELAKNKLKNDSLLYERQLNLWKEKIGTKVELENKEINFKNSKTNYFSAIERLDNLKRQIEISAIQANNNLKIAEKVEQDFEILSLIEGKVYSLNVKKGEIVSPQIPIAIIGSNEDFILEMQIDERDITQIKVGLDVVVSLNSYSNRIFNAKITKINPIMNEQTKTFLVEAEFIEKPDKLYPNLTFEANIITNSKENALLIPIEYLQNDSIVVLSSGEEKVVKTGLKDFKMVEILSGLSKNDKLIKQ